MSISSGQHVGVIIVDTYCGEDTDSGVVCRYEGDTDVTADIETNTAHWTCPTCQFEHVFPASNLWEIP